MSSWLYNPETGKAGEGPDGIVPRHRIEEAAEVLYQSGIRNQLLIADVLIALSGLSKPEVRFNVELALNETAVTEFRNVGSAPRCAKRERILSPGGVS